MMDDDGDFFGGDDLAADDEMDAFDEAAPSDASSEPFVRFLSPSFCSVCSADLERQMSSDVAALRDVTGLDEDTAVALLRRNRWARERLIERFIENPDATLADAGFVFPQQSRADAAAEAGKPSFLCPICLEETRREDTFALGCGHRYCVACWVGFLQGRLANAGSEVAFTHCPAPKCRCPVPDSAFRRFLSGEVQLRRFVDATVRVFVDADPHKKWCPGLGCTSVMQVESVARAEPVVCQACGLVYCFRCSDVEIGDHRPCPCDEVRIWLEKASKESENVKWLSEHTKRCPRCHAPIEKNGGCMHMTCRKQSGGCGFEFCWLCRGPWSEHGSHTGGYYACNKFDPKKKDDSKASDTKSALEHYMFYFSRYDAHRQAKIVAERQLRSCARREEELAARFVGGVGDSGGVDIKFLEEATRALVECRRTLMWSYAFGFFLPLNAPQRTLFEFLQEDLEKHANFLSELYEKNLDEITDFPRWREDITNFTRVTLKYLSNFNSGVEKGLSSVTTTAAEPGL